MEVQIELLAQTPLRGAQHITTASGLPALEQWIAVMDFFALLGANM